MLKCVMEDGGVGGKAAVKLETEGDVNKPSEVAVIGLTERSRRKVLSLPQGRSDRTEDGSHVWI